MKKSCAMKKQRESEKIAILEDLIRHEKCNEVMVELEKANIILRKKVEMNEKCITNTNNIGRDMNTNNGIINNITLVAYGSEDMSKLDKNELLKILKQGYNSTLKLTEVVHFNPKYPEYHNIYITNMKDKYAMIYDGENWTLTMKDELINRIYDDKKNYIEDNLEEFVESLTVSQRRALERWTNTDDQDKKIREIKDRIKLLLYNYKQIPIATQNKIGNSNIKVLCM
jgi:hypothetical protein